MKDDSPDPPDSMSTQLTLCRQWIPGSDNIFVVILMVKQVSCTKVVMAGESQPIQINMLTLVS